MFRTNIAVKERRQTFVVAVAVSARLVALTNCDVCARASQSASVGRRLVGQLTPPCIFILQALHLCLCVCVSHTLKHTRSRSLSLPLSLTQSAVFVFVENKQQQLTS